MPPMKAQLTHGAYILARYSTDHQKEDSIEVQVDRCRRWCEDRGLPVLDVFADAAVSGMKDTRPEYARMMRQLRAGGADTVVVYDQSRMFRKMSAWFTFRAELDRLGARVVSITQPMIGGDLRDPSNFMSEGITAIFSQSWALQTRQKVVEKMRFMAENGQFTGGKPALGFEVKDGRLVICEAEAAVVREIFSAYAGGASYREIIAGLNAAGRRTKRGGAFGTNSLHDLLKNEKYIGVLSYGRVGRDPDGHRNSHAAAGADVIRLENAIPAIIDRETWEKVQRRMAQNKKQQAGRPAAAREYPLKGKVFCGECGAAMTVTATNVRGQKYYYYSCTGKKRRGDCDNIAMRADKLEQRVADLVRLILGDPANLDGLISIMREEREKVQGDMLERLSTLTARRADVQAEIKRGVDAVFAGLNTPELTARVNSLEAEKAQLDHDLQQLHAAARGSDLTDDELRSTFSRIIGTREGDAALLSVVVRVEIGREEVTVWTLLDADPDGNFDFSHDGGRFIKILGDGPPAPEKAPRKGCLFWCAPTARMIRFAQISRRGHPIPVSFPLG